MSTMLSCPYKYYLSYVEGRKWDFTPSAVSFGGVMHNVLAEYNKSLMNGGQIPEDELKDKFRKHFFYDANNNNVLFKDESEQKSLFNTGQKLVEAYHDRMQKVKPSEVEMEFRLPVIDSQTGEQAKRDVVGKIDLIIDNVICDIKTAGKSMSERVVDYDLQLMLYGWAYKVMFGSAPKQMCIINLVKTKVPKIQIVTTNLNDDKQEKMIALVFRILQAIEKDAFYPNPMSKYGCDSCPYCTTCEYIF